MPLKQTPSQTVGPFFAYGLTPQQYGYDLRSLFTPVLAEPHAEGEHVRIAGRVLDGAGEPVGDAMIEIAQADGAGRRPRSREEAAALGFRGFGRAGTAADGSYGFLTVKPGAAGDGQAPHVDVIVTMRGLLNHVFTRIYFEDLAEANASDRVLAQVPAPRRETLIARRDPTPAGIVYRFDIRMQGERETVFFDL